MTIAKAAVLADTWGMHDDVGWGWMTLMMVLMVVFWGAVIFGVVWLVRGAFWSGTAPGGAQIGRESPVEILERRFAEGAITAEDYRARRDILVSRGGEPGASG